jgi:hypothetical protein
VRARGSPGTCATPPDASNGSGPGRLMSTIIGNSL